MTNLVDLPVARFNKVPLRSVQLDQAVDFAIEHATQNDSAVAIRLVNSYSIALASKEASYQELLCRPGSVNLPDGLPLSIALKHIVKAGPSTGQVRGPSFFELCIDRGRASGLRHYFLGGSEETLTKLADAATRKYPGVEIVGTLSPPFRMLSDDERAEQDANIKASEAQIVWVGLGTPKQDFEAQRIVNEVGVTSAAVGAAFDFLAGSKPTAPKLMQKTGTEWLFRLASEPRRLWRRYLFGNARFLVLAARASHKTAQ